MCGCGFICWSVVVVFVYGRLVQGVTEIEGLAQSEGKWRPKKR